MILPLVVWISNFASACLEKLYDFALGAWIPQNHMKLFEFDKFGNPRNPRAQGKTMKLFEASGKFDKFENPRSPRSQAKIDPSNPPPP
jgi:hypothetical protein